MNPIVLNMLKRFLPQIKQAALPTISDMLAKATEGIELQDGEDSANIVISQYNGEWWVYIVTMSPANAVVRSIKNMKLEELLSAGFSNLEDQC